MSQNTNPKKEDSSSSSINEDSKIFKPEEIEIINTSFSYSIPTSSMYYTSEDILQDKDITDKNTKKASSKDENENVKQLSEEKPNKSSITSSLQNNINNTSPKTKSTITDEKMSDSNKLELDNSSVIVEIDHEESINIDNSISLPSNIVDSSFVIANKQNEDNNDPNLKKKIELAENRISLATSGGITYVNNDQDIPMPADSDIVNSNLKNLTDPTPVHDGSIKEKDNVNEIDKESGDIANHEHAITIEDEEEDNTCAICLIETQKPSDINNNKDGSNETVVAPSKEEIDNYECKLHCMHKFHYSCIAQWLERSQNCPICRVDIKHYEIEAIEKRFDITIKIKDDNRVQLVRPRYNTTFDFNIELTEELVRNYMSEHFPLVNFKIYFFTKFFFFFLGYIFLTIAGIVLSINSFLKGNEMLYFPHYVIVIILIIGSILHSIQFYLSIKKKKAMKFIIMQPTASPIFYGLVAFLFVVLFNSLGYFVETKNDPYSWEKIFIYFIVLFFSILMFWSCVEAIYCYKMFKEDDHRRVDEEVNRRNQEILERSRIEEAEERQYFEEHYSHLND